MVPLLLVCVILATLTSGISAAGPTFTPGTVSVSVAEGVAAGTTVLDVIEVTDPDPDNTQLTVDCLGEDKEFNPCDYFEVVQTGDSESRTVWTGCLKTKRVIDYELVTSFEVNIRARDDRDFVVQTYFIEVINGPDSPPVFTGGLRANVQEDVPVGTTVVRVRAEDGDKSMNRAIAYSLVGESDLFRIDALSGNLITLMSLDRESGPISEGTLTIQVQATELVSPGIPDNSPESQTVATVTIVVADVNDNAPTFVPQTIQVKFDESIPNGATIPGLSAYRVVDLDEGDNSEFELVLLDHTDKFSVTPTKGRGLVAPSVTITNNTGLDYEMGVRDLTLRLEARETRTSDRLSSLGVIYVTVMDANDNPPVFRDPAYYATIDETARQGTKVITVTATDRDTGSYGVAGLRYKLTGIGKNNFYVNRYNGEIEVRNPSDCWKPGSDPCLDAETQRVYNLTLLVTDNYAEGLQAAVPVVITLRDVNDNEPGFAISEYVGYVREGESVLEDPVTVEATDRDIPGGINSVITYHILGGDPTQLWSLDPNTGTFVPRRPIPYPDPQGFYLVTVEAKDPDFVATTTVKIFVRDINNHPPLFSQNGFYEETIPEDTAPGTVVETVSAQDGDSSSSPNGVFRYRWISGGRGKFLVDGVTGQVTVAPDAVFDYDDINRYVIYLTAEDEGEPRLSSNATLVINILDANNKQPYFSPSTQRADVRETESPGVVVTTMTAMDPDSNALLRYYLQEPIKAWDRQNAEIPNHPYKNWFSIEESTGVVRVAAPLSRDSAIRWSGTVRVEDINAGGNDQTATGSVVITILEVNARPPVFGPPWTPENPNIDLSVREGQQPGAFVTLITATDPTDGIGGFTLLSNPGGYFTVKEDTGVISIARPLDYEQTPFTTFVVVVTDAGQPPLSATATFNVNIINVNDETPVFSPLQYETRLLENSPGGTSVIRVTASDKDRGDYGVVRYMINQPEDRFNIDPQTGLITVAQGAVLDKETQRSITIEVQAYDSPQDDTVRKYSSLSRVQIYLLDEDEFPPSLGQPGYSAVVSEKSPPGTSVIQLTGSDPDDAETNFVYTEQAGDPRDLFSIDPTTGLITTRGDLEDASGVYNLTIVLRNGGRTDTAYVGITVYELDNSPPGWVYPNDKNQTVRVYENQPVGLLVARVRAMDPDQGLNGNLDYGFDVNGVMVDGTDEFAINKQTGWITARVSFDREEEDTYILQLVARDRGLPAMDTKQTLVVEILDMPDNEPSFPTFKNGSSMPYSVSVLETAPKDILIGTVAATDRDEGDAKVITYSIYDGNVDNTFKIDPSSGVIHLNNRSLDHERVPLYTLTILASNPPTPGSNVTVGGPGEPSCTPGCTDPSYVLLYVYVLDVNEEAPQFSDDVFNSCISVDAPIGKSVTTMRATDPDTSTSDGVEYRLYNISLTDPRVKGETGGQPATTPVTIINRNFTISNSSGVVASNDLMQRYEEQYFAMSVSANDDLFKSEAKLRIWVTPPAKEVKVEIDDTKDNVEANLDKHLQEISEATGFGIVCVNSIRYHVTIGGDGGSEIDVSRTDLFIHVIDRDSLIIMDPDDVNGLLTAKFVSLPVLGTAEQWTGFIRDPVLVAIIIVAVLLLIALIALCFICWCWSAIFKKTKYVEAPRIINAGTVNPLWKGFEDQELTMSVADGDAKLKATSGYVNTAYDDTDAMVTESKVANGMVSHEEINIRETVHTVDHAASNGAPLIIADLAGSSSRVADLSGSSNHLHGNAAHHGSLSVLSSDTMNRGIQTDEAPATLNTSFEHPLVQSARIGATLSRTDLSFQPPPTATTTTSGAFDYDDFGTTTNHVAYSRSTERINLHGPMENAHPPRATTLPRSANVDQPDGFYQGEIHLGTLPHQSSQSVTYAQPVPPVMTSSTNQNFQYQETQFSERRQYQANGVQGSTTTLPRINTTGPDGDTIEYVAF